MVSQRLIAISTILGTIFGAGILGIPYVVMKSGFAIGIIHFLIFCAVNIIVMLYLGEIALRTKENYQLTGYAGKYLGKKGRLLMFIAIAAGLYAALLAYLIGESKSISTLLTGTTNYAMLAGISFWIIMLFLSYYGQKALEKASFFGASIILATVVLIAATFSSKINISNLSYINSSEIFTPFGVVLFAFLAFSIIPEIEKILKKDKDKFKSSIIISYVIAFFVYLIFTAIVLGYKGSSTPEIATLGLGNIFTFLGMITMFTAYLALSIALIDTYHLDLKVSKIKSLLLVSLPPLVLFVALEIFHNSDFTKVLGIGGVISGGLTAILVLIIAKIAKKKGNQKPPYQIPYSLILTIILSILFIIGVIVEVLSIING